MPPNWPEVAVLVALTLCAAFFAASEAALVSISRVHARSMVDRDLRNAGSVAQLVDDRNRTLTTILIANTVVLLAADSLATEIAIELGLPNAALWSTIAMTIVLLLFGEIIPKTLAVTDSQRWALGLAPFLRLVVRILWPITAGFLATTNLIVRISGGRPVHGPYITEEDIKSIVNVGVEQNVLEEQERELIHSVIQFGDTIVREVMTPRPDMVAVAVTSSPRRALDLVIAEGYSKIPVFEDTIDNVIGVVHDRELLIVLANGSIANTSLRALMRPIVHVPESKKTAELLREMQRGKYSVAIVLDEYGGTEGIVTMEDLLEEIVGEIRDEHDEGEVDPIRRVNEYETVVEAAVNIEDVNAALGLELPHEDFETIGGYTVGVFGRLAREGEEVEVDGGVRLRVERTRGRRILGVRVFTSGKAHATTQSEAAQDDARV